MTTLKRKKRAKMAHVKENAIRNTFHMRNWNNSRCQRAKEKTNHLIVVHEFVETRNDWEKPKIYTHIRDGQSHFMNGNNLIWLLLSPFSWLSEEIWHLHSLNLVSLKNQRYVWRASMIQQVISARRKTDCNAHHLTSPHMYLLRK